MSRVKTNSLIITEMPGSAQWSVRRLMLKNTYKIALGTHRVRLKPE